MHQVQNHDPIKNDNQNPKPIKSRRSVTNVTRLSRTFVRAEAVQRVYWRLRVLIVDHLEVGVRLHNENSRSMRRNLSHSIHISEVLYEFDLV
mmetsp:Transcript_7333/g.13246  ORF Transcript_7333/g.13246 Transcript_7333/m.13246 type:complete len:92 (-) Transcript_7333:860-1135(-)